jgi:hypothetical protein
MPAAALAALQHLKQLDSRRRSSGIQSLPSYIERCDAVLIPYLAPAQPAAAMTSSLASASGASLAAATVGTNVGTSVGTSQQQKHRVFTTALKGAPGNSGSSAGGATAGGSSGTARLDGKRSPTPSVRLFGGLPTAATAAMQDDDQVSTSPDKFATVARSAGGSCCHCTTVKTVR